MEKVREGPRVNEVCGYRTVERDWMMLGDAGFVSSLQPVWLRCLSSREAPAFRSKLALRGAGRGSGPTPCLGNLSYGD